MSTIVIYNVPRLPIAVAHADEVISLAPDGQHIVVADTELAWALLLWADSIRHDAPMLQGMNGLGALGIQVWSVVNNLALRTYNLFQPENIAGRLWAVQKDLAGKYKLDLPVSPPIKGQGNQGNRKLTRAGAFTAFLTTKRYFRVEFTEANTYRVRYTDNPNDPPESWATDPKVGEVKWDRYEVFAEAKAYIFPESWGGSAAQSGDTFTFSADPTAGIVRMPVLFQPSTSPTPGTPRTPGMAVAYTTNHVNSLIDPGIPSVHPAVAVTGGAYGPWVAYKPPDDPSDILMDYVSSVFSNLGLTPVPVDARYYHDGLGSVHCGTNAIRVIPADKWWV